MSQEKRKKSLLPGIGILRRQRTNKQAEEEVGINLLHPVKHGDRAKPEDNGDISQASVEEFAWEVRNYKHLTVDVTSR